MTQEYIIDHPEFQNGFTGEHQFLCSTVLGLLDVLRGPEKHPKHLSEGIGQG
jgi:hypothetical protein